MNDQPLPFPPTNYLIVGEKVDADEGVELSESHNEVLAAPRFLKLSAHRHKETNEVFELVERPHQTIDILPWIDDEGQILVFAKKDFPRPLVNACADQVRLGSASLSGYITEPISAIVEGPPSREAVIEILREPANLIEADLILDRRATLVLHLAGRNQRARDGVSGPGAPAVVASCRVSELHIIQKRRNRARA